MIIALIFLLIVSIAAAGYLGYRAYYLAGSVADAQEYIEELEVTNTYMYTRIVDSYNTMQEIDRLGSFEAEDEAGTTFKMLLQTITELKETFDGEASEEKK
jgi:hypothetical protein